MNHLFFQARLWATMPPSVHSVELQAMVAAYIRYFQHQCCSLAAAEQIRYATTASTSASLSVSDLHTQTGRQTTTPPWIDPSRHLQLRAEEAEMLSTAAVMFDIALTGESLHVCFSSSNEHQELKWATTTAGLAQVCPQHMSHVLMSSGCVNIGREFNIHCLRRSATDETETNANVSRCCRMSTMPFLQSQSTRWSGVWELFALRK